MSFTFSTDALTPATPALLESRAAGSRKRNTRVARVVAVGSPQGSCPSAQAAVGEGLKPTTRRCPTFRGLGSEMLASRYALTRTRTPRELRWELEEGVLTKRTG
ncbi:MAG: hypothetical protein QW185_04735 [Thermofilum sp.]